jgi:hypothetical protein
VVNFCTITSQTEASCQVTGLPPERRRFTLTASGPWTMPPPTVQLEYRTLFGRVFPLPDAALTPVTNPGR